MAADTDHARIVDRLALTHERRIAQSLQALEERIAAYAVQAPTKDGQLFDLAWALQARKDIPRFISSTYLTEADSIVREYDQVFDSISAMFEKYESFNGVSPEVVRNLKRISFQGFQDIAVTFADELATELYQSTLVGRPIEESIKNIRQKVNGVYMQSDQVEIQRLVNIANAGGDEAEDAVRELHQRYAADRTGNNMRRYARQMVHDSIMQFDASVNVAAGKEIGAEKWKYFGSLVEDSRSHCIKYKDKVLTEKEIRSIWANTTWQGKSDGDPFVVRGGYNCRHHWRPYFDEFDDTPDVKTQDESIEPRKRMNLSGVDGSRTVISAAETIMTNEVDPLCVAVANKLPKPNSMVQGRGVYRRNIKQLSTTIIGTDSDKNRVTAHEYGHHVDYEIGEIRARGPKGKAFSETDGAFVEAFKEDRKALGLVPQTTRKSKTYEVMEELFEPNPTGRGWVFGRSDTNLCDILDSMSGGIARYNLHGFGHSKSYWKRKGAKEKECFANMFSLYGTENWPKVERIAPRMARRFLQILNEVADGR